ncbi:MAG: GNAT family N-acetyltransferase [Gammaproteobacteria bacterium]|nr:GNAT family N-acetyltransferase [Gammaproteobacteria bacterium]
MIETARLHISPFSSSDFDIFVSKMLTDPRVVQFYYSYQDLDNLEDIRRKAESDFWNEFEMSRDKYGWPTWSARERSNEEVMIGWCGLLHGELSDIHGKPELQYMISGSCHGKGFATEFAGAVLQRAANDRIADSVVATVDIPNIGSVKVLEKLGFQRIGQTSAYGSDEMYLYELSLVER